ncbi:FBP domain-containing protein [Microbacterium sp. CJ88]|uniref:FBP domain-containing protein n=1 Tax=Microbacterium sp. CJ88 TaxID=3445672 RepID=UPI003F65B4ED
MNLFTPERVRASFTNVSMRERAAITLPDLDSFDPERAEFLGWRDRKYPNLGYVVVDLDGDLVGVALRQSDASPRSRPQCAWCADVTLPNDVVFFSARRSGRAGRNGDSIGTLVCAQFECPVNVRRRPPSAYLGFDVDAARERRIAALGDNVRGFVREVLDRD